MANKKTIRKKASETAAPTNDKFPQLREAMAGLQAEREKVTASLAPLRDKRDKLRDKIAGLEADLRAINKELLGSPENQRLFELDNQIGALARGMGARSMLRSEG
jgi:septal ring factor EnvC (AmiA/AmiB activator)